MAITPRAGALYLLTPPQIGNAAHFMGELEEALSTGAVEALQIRLKSRDVAGDECPAPDEAWRRFAPPMIELARRFGVASIINDRIDIACALKADGVHLGQEDGEVRLARDALGPEAIIGVTCHDSRHLAIEAAEAGADYVAFGAFFTTATKAPKTVATTEILEWWSQMMTLPCVAIGGITPDNCGPLIEAGADYCAMTGAIWNHPQGARAGVLAYAAARQRFA
jgi:thiamine-phosphate pyrophosphorylase